MFMSLRQLDTYTAAFEHTDLVEKRLDLGLLALLLGLVRVGLIAVKVGLA